MDLDFRECAEAGVDLPRASTMVPIAMSAQFNCTKTLSKMQKPPVFATNARLFEAAANGFSNESEADSAR